MPEDSQAPSFTTGPYAAFAANPFAALGSFSTPAFGATPARRPA